MRPWFRLIPLLVLSACSLLPDESADPRPQSTPADAAPVDSAAPDPDAADRDLGVADAGADAADGERPPVDAEPVPDGGNPCTWPADCEHGDCVDGACFNRRPVRCPGGDDAECPEGEVCGGFHNRFYCFLPCELEQTCTIRPRPCGAHVDCPSSTSCHGGLCINSCTLDTDCGGEGYCYEGECRPFPAELFEGDPPAPRGQPGQLHAGVGVVSLDYPIGVSMAGYGGRPGKRTPYNKALGGSDRVLEHQDVRAVALSTDEDILVVLRLPHSWSTDYMMTLTALKLQALTVSPEHPKGLNFLGKIVSAATHSHSQPGRYWNLVPATGFGVFGYGTFSPEMVNRYTDSAAQAIKAALDDLRPARIGWTIVDDFDPEGRIHSDRRGESPHFKDGRMLVWRLEDLEGRAMAGLVNFAIHGTHMEETWVTGDVAGPIEQVATEKLSAAAGHPVPVLFINGNAGDVSPRGDDTVSPPWGKIQVVGHRVWPIFKAAWDAIQTTAEVHLEVVHRRIPVSYEHLGYGIETEEFAYADGSRQVYGAFQCVQVSREGDAPPYTPSNISCRLNLEAFLGAPVVQFQKTVLAAFRLNDLVVTTLPGEPSSWMGAALSEQVEADAAALGFPNVRVMQFGYSMDHHLYLLLEDDWFRGGYEAAQGVWGWREGGYLVRQSRALARQLFTPEKEDNETGIKPTWWWDLPDDTVPPTEGGTAAGTLVADTDDTRRGDLIEIRWAGGHPGVDLPHATLEIEEGDQWAPALKPGGIPYDNHSGLETLLIYGGDYAADHTWIIRWELPFDMPTGRYRVRLAGHHFAGGRRQSYEATTSPFRVDPATLVVREASVTDGTVAFKVNYPNGPTNDRGDNAFERLESTGHLMRVDPNLRVGGATRERSFVLGPALPAGLPVAVTVGEEAPVEVAGQADQVAVDLVTARDAEGNVQTQRLEGWVTTRVELPAPAEAGTHRVAVRDAFGNSAEVEVEVP